MKTVVVIYLLLAIGWLINAIQFGITVAQGGTIGTYEALQGIGTFLIPLGAIMGWASLFV